MDMDTPEDMHDNLMRINELARIMAQNHTKIVVPEDLFALLEFWYI
jgi:hypothetical protein